ncbi:MAG: hypothetical protein M3P82_02345, partial [Bacteroidota bacterium]|nr:hypothetical protein [Bacteroidota bacterium]
NPAHTNLPVSTVRIEARNDRNLKLLRFPLKLSGEKYLPLKMSKEILYTRIQQNRLNSDEIRIELTIKFLITKLAVPNTITYKGEVVPAVGSPILYWNK